MPNLVEIEAPVVKLQRLSQGRKSSSRAKETRFSKFQHAAGAQTLPYHGDISFYWMYFKFCVWCEGRQGFGGNILKNSKVSLRAPVSALGLVMAHSFGFFTLFHLNPTCIDPGIPL